MSFCNTATDTCACDPAFATTTTTPKSCTTPFQGRSVGETCVTSSECGLYTDCTDENKTCQCQDGWRKKSDLEFWEDPSDLTECVLEEYSSCKCYIESLYIREVARCSSVVRAFARGAMDRRIDPSWWTH